MENCHEMTAAKPIQPLLFDIPAAPKRVRSKWEELQEMAEVGQQVGGLVFPTLAATLLDLSRQRVNQLQDEGTFKTWEFFGKKYISINEIRAFMDVERKAGRPWTEPSTKELWKRSRELAEGKR